MLRWLTRLRFGRRNNIDNAPPRAGTAVPPSAQPRDRWGPASWLLGGALWGGLWSTVFGHTHHDHAHERDGDRQQPTPDPNDWRGVGPGPNADGSQPIESSNEGGGAFDGGGAGGGFDAGGLDGGHGHGHGDGGGGGGGDGGGGE